MLHTKRRLLSLIITVSIILSAMGTPTVHAATAYDLWVEGVRVTSSNKSDVLGDGTVSYDSSDQILKLSGATIDAVCHEGEYPAAIYSGLSSYLIVEVYGDNTINTSHEKGSAAIFAEGELLTVSGSGSLDAVGGDYGIFTQGNLNITGAIVEAVGDSFGVYVSGGNVNMLSGALAAEGGAAAIAVYGGEISLADGMSDGVGFGTVSTRTDGDGVSFETVVSEDSVAVAVDIRVWEYVLWINGRQVTGKNASDIFGDGSASFDIKTRTLTLSGVSIGVTYAYDGSKTSGLYSEVDGLRISLEGENRITANPQEKSDGITSIGDLTIVGDGSLTVNSGANGINVAGDLNIDGGELSVSLVTGSENGVYCRALYVRGGSISASKGRYGFYVEGDLNVTGGSLSSSLCSVAGVYSKTGDFTVDSGDVGAYGQRYGVLLEVGDLVIGGGVVSIGHTGTVLSPIAAYIKGGNISLAFGMVDTKAGAVPTSLSKQGQRFCGFAVGGKEVSEVTLEILPYSLTVTDGTYTVMGESAEKIYPGETVTITANEPAVGYEFAGWSVISGEVELADVGAAVTTFIMPVSDVKIAATFRPMTFSITYDANGGTGEIPGFTASYGDTVTLGDCPFEAPVEYEFKGWKVNGVEYAVGDSFTVTENAVIAPVWRHIIKTEITEITVTEVESPTEYSSPSNHFLMSGDGVFAQVNSYWYDCSSDRIMGEGDVFGGGETYRFEIELLIDTRYYVFADIDTINATVNGKEATLSIEGDRLVVSITFDSVPVDGDLLFDTVIHKTETGPLVAVYDGAATAEDILADMADGTADMSLDAALEITGTAETGCTVTSSVRVRSLPLGEYIIAVAAEGHSTKLIPVTVSLDEERLDAVSPSLMGDACGDCRVNLYDASLMMQYIARWDVSVDTVAADVNCDGTVNNEDVMRLLKYLVGWEGITLG